MQDAAPSWRLRVLQHPQPSCKSTIACLENAYHGCPPLGNSSNACKCVLPDATSPCISRFRRHQTAVHGLRLRRPPPRQNLIRVCQRIDGGRRASRSIGRDSTQPPPSLLLVRLPSSSYHASLPTKPGGVRITLRKQASLFDAGRQGDDSKVRAAHHRHGSLCLSLLPRMEGNNRGAAQQSGKCIECVSCWGREWRV